MTWRIWYEGGGTYDAAQGPPETSPAWGAVVIGQRTTAYKSALFSGVPWFVYRTDYGFWVELDDTGLLDTLVHHAPAVQAVRAGRYIRSPEFWACVKAAEAWVRDE